jgi:hypothetical protein
MLDSSIFARISAVSFDGKPKCKNPLFITAENFIPYFVGMTVKNEVKKFFFCSAVKELVVKTIKAAKTCDVKAEAGDHLVRILHEWGQWQNFGNRYFSQKIVKNGDL